jgi:hypothetical protein
MTDVIFIAVIVVFFVAGALLVRVLDQMIVHSGAGADSDSDSDSDSEAAGLEPEPGGAA